MPMARVSTLVTDVDHKQSGVGGAGCNRPVEGDNTMTADSFCIASDCMILSKID